jgi:hypothetical protein
MEGRNQSSARRTTRTENSQEIAAGAPPCRRAAARRRRRRAAALGRAGACVRACVRPSARVLCVRGGLGQGLG